MRHPKCKDKPWDPNLVMAAVRGNLRRALEWIVRRVTARWRGLPHVYIAGPKKGGTTSLFRYLLAHPRVCAPFRKEIKFYNYHYYLGERWYRANFSRASRGERCLFLDATPDYFMYPCFPVRLMQTTPQAKVIVLLRDPTQRILSHYFHNRRLGIEPFTLAEALALESKRLEKEGALCDDPCVNPWTYHRYGYVTESKYYVHLERLWRYVPREQTLVLRSEDFFAHPREVAHQVAKFLEIEPWETEWQPYNVGQYTLSDMEQSVARELRIYFRPHNQRLYALLGRDLGWEDA
ncbi:MAG TPA: sulfotransferase [Anaerolineales bacterium]|nr:sulfotransferase [Anaerolineales bacterium]